MSICRGRAKRMLDKKKAIDQYIKEMNLSKPVSALALKGLGFIITDSQKAGKTWRHVSR